MTYRSMLRILLPSLFLLSCKKQALQTSMPKDLNGIFMSIENDRFNATLRPFEHNWDKQKMSLDRRAKTQFLKEAESKGGVDPDNFYVEWRHPSATGEYVRTLKVFFDVQNQPTVAVSERSGSGANSVTDFYILCYSEGTWRLCTNDKIQTFFLQDILKPGYKSEDVAMLYQYHRLPVKGDTIILNFIFDEYSLLDMSVKPRLSDYVSKLQHPQYKYKWSPSENRFMPLQ